MYFYLSNSPIVWHSCGFPFFLIRILNLFFYRLGGEHVFGSIGHFPRAHSIHPKLSFRNRRRSSNGRHIEPQHDEDQLGVWLR